MPDYRYRIETDTATIETDDLQFACVAAGVADDGAFHHQLQSDIDIDTDRLEHLCAAWERRAGSSSNHTEERVAYCDAAEKLRAVLNGSPWTETP